MSAWRIVLAYLLLGGCMVGSYWMALMPVPNACGLGILAFMVGLLALAFAQDDGAVRSRRKELHMVKKFRKKPELFDAFTFDELVQFGRDNGANIVNGMPWSFTFKGYPVTHENDDCYLFSVSNGFTTRFERGNILVVAEGWLDTITPDAFEARYEPA